MNILNVEKVSKTFGEKVLLDNVTLGINKGDKVGIAWEPGTLTDERKNEILEKMNC